MDLANTDIEIRERPLPQRIDLALRYVATRAAGVLLSAALGVVPALALNAALLYLLDPFQAWNNVSWFTTWVMMWYMTMVEAPFVMAPVVVYLGQALFRQPWSWRLICREVWLRGWRQFLVHGIIRTQVVWLGLAMLAYASTAVEMFYFVVVCGVMFGSITWCLRPYVDQIIYLERLPLAKGAGQRITIGKRSGLLHGFDGAAIFVESMAVWCLSGLLFYGMYAILLWGYYWTTFNTVTQDWFSWSWFALSLWGSILVATVLRFFGYLDTRIRSEGWELELRVRREAIVQAAAGRIAPTPGRTKGGV